jgi:MFS family permease
MDQKSQISNKSDGDAPVRQKSLLMRSKSSVKLPDTGEEQSVGEQIKNIGWGRYQIQSFFFCQAVLMSESSQLSVISGVKPMLYAEFNINTPADQANLMLILFTGFMLGTMACGTLGDWKGRRLPMLLGALGMVTSQLILFFAHSLPLFYTFVFVIGFSAGLGIPAAITFICEVCPDDVRGLFGAAMCFGFSMGEFWSATGLRIFTPTLNSGPWRSVLLWAAIPPLTFLVFGCFARVTKFDSPHFLAVHSRVKELRGVMNLMAEMNNKPDLVLLDVPDKIAADHEETSVTLLQALRFMCTGQMGVRTFVLCVLFLGYNLGYYGTLDFWPIGWQRLNLKGLYPTTELILTACLGLAGTPIAMYALNGLPRRVGLCGAGLLCSAAAACLIGLLVEQLVIGWIGVIVFKLVWMVYEMTVVNLPGEIYPTRVSVWGWSIVGSVGRVASLVAPIIISQTNKGFLISLAVLLFIASLLVWLLPETKDIDLEELDHEYNEALGGAHVEEQKEIQKNYGSCKA